MSRTTAALVRGLVGAAAKDVNGGIQVAAKGSGTAGVRAVTPASRPRRGSADAEEHRQGLHSALFGSD